MDLARLKTYGWPLVGIYLIAINIISLIAGIITRYPYEALWISYYVGIFQGINCFWKFSKPLLTGIYCYLFIFMLGSVTLHIIRPVYINYLDVLYWFYHIPHLMGFYLIIKRDFETQGLHYGLIFLLSMFILSWYVLFLSNDPTKYMINTAFSVNHALIVGLAFAWYIALICFNIAKKRQPHAPRWLLLYTQK